MKQQETNVHRDGERLSTMLQCLLVLNATSIFINCDVSLADDKCVQVPKGLTESETICTQRWRVVGHHAIYNAYLSLMSHRSSIIEMYP